MPSCSRIDERYHDVSCAFGYRQALVVVGQPSGVHQHPPLLGASHAAVVPEEVAAAPLVVDAGVVHGDVDRVRGGVMMGSQVGLLVRPVPDHEVHDRPRRLKNHKLVKNPRFDV